MVTFSVSKSEVASWVNKLPTSLASSRKQLGADVAFAHQADLSSLTRGCLTSTTFIIISSNRRQKIAESYNKSHGL